MSIPTERTMRTVALIGNPNTGKSTIFGALVGVRQHVGNYPGVTVEKKTGHLDHAGRRYELIDLPGLYSLAPRSRDEMVAVDVLLGRCRDCAPVDTVVCIVDASNLQRSFYLVSQVLEFGLPTVLVVNMLDVAEKQGMVVELDRLAEQLGIQVVATQANRRIGIAQLKAALAECVGRGVHQEQSPFPEAFEREVSPLQSSLADDPAVDGPKRRMPRCLARRLLLDCNGYLERALLAGKDPELGQKLEAARARLADADCAVPSIETKARYAWARRVLEGVVSEPSRYATTASDRIDRLLTHRVWGTVVFALLMVVVFQSVFAWAQPLIEIIEAATSAVGHWVEVSMAEGALRSLVVEGIVGGAGSVLAFLPPILILFFFIAVLEDCGYMARAAYLMDKVMVRVGLSGKSFIPMLSSFACAIPGIMAARVIEDERDRLTTIMVAPLMSCSARLPIYSLLIPAFIPRRAYLGGLLNLQGLTMVGLYALGIVTAVIIARTLKRTVLRGQAPPFLMELPAYKRPSPSTVFYRVVQRGWLFLRCAGTLILAVSVVVWAALYYPHNSELVEAPLRPRQEKLEAQLQILAEDDPRREAVRQQLNQIDHEITGAYQRQSLLGRLGRVIEPVVKPLGWDWRIGCAVIASFPAREIVVATMGVVFNAGEDLNVESQEGSTQMRARLYEATWDNTDKPLFNVPVALSILVFFALCAQCAATLAVIKRETNSWRWPAFTFAYMTALAYLGALVTYQVGTWLGALSG
ncbi:MAG: ferrous iron transport protein B [Planctomycetes bacterium RBG_13_63_9]|nr:MAG: ferrous iron transport protein B [Planctomycetes bacterium RBG_13_63_9]